MAGLAIGAYFIGRKIDRTSSPLRIYAFLELGVCIWALLLFPFLQAARPLYAKIQFMSGLSGTSHSLIVFVLAALPLLPPAIFMGATLPALLSFIERSGGPGRSGIGDNVSLLYGLNTLGAVAGTIISGFVLIGSVGLARTNVLTASLNLLLFMAAIFLSFRWEPLKSVAGTLKRNCDPGAVESGIRYEGTSRRTLLIILYSASGFTALAYEVIWTRILIHYVGTTYYAFSLMLVIYLFGIAAGSIVFRWISRRFPVRMFHFGVTELLIGISGGLGLAGVTWLGSLHVKLLEAGGGGFWDEVGIIMLASGLLMILPTFLFGIAFPMVSELMSSDRLEAGRDVGVVYSANTIGSIGGSMAAVFLIIPVLGTAGGVILCSVINLAVASVVFLIYMGRRSLLLTAIAAIGAVLMPVVLPSSILGGMFPEEVTLFEEEGSEATVAVIRDQGPLSLDFKRMIVDGNALSGSDYSGRRYMRLLGLLPVLLCDSPDRVLVICLGTGMTLGACAGYEKTREVVCVEISPEVVKAARQFTVENYAVLDGGKARLEIGDGRNFLLAYEGALDVITLEPPPPRARGVVNLYSKDFYELCRRRLSGRGIMAQWIPLHDQSEEDVKTLIKTFMSVFDHTTAWLVERHDICLIGSMKPLSIDVEEIRRRMRGAKEELADIDITSPWDMLSLFVADEKGLAGYCGDVSVITDDLPLIEHFLSLPWNSNIIAAPPSVKSEKSFLEDLMLYRTALSRHIFWERASDTTMEYLKHRLAMNAFIDGVIYTDRGLISSGLEEMRKAHRLLPSSEYFKHYLGSSKSQREELEALLMAGGGDPGYILQRYGHLELEERNYDRAREVFMKYTSLFPDDPAGYINLALASEELGDVETARQAYGKALFLAPERKETLGARLAALDLRERAEVSGDVADLDELAQLYWRDARYEEAARIYAGMVRSDPRNEPARFNLAASLEGLGYYLDALSEYETALDLDPDVPETRNNVEKLKLLMAILSEDRVPMDFPDGVRLEVDFSDPASHAMLGRLYARNDEYGKARRSFLRALALDPGYEEARRILQTVEEISGGRVSGENDSR